jgi:hypothetical protein
MLLLEEVASHDDSRDGGLDRTCRLKLVELRRWRSSGHPRDQIDQKSLTRGNIEGVDHTQTVQDRQRYGLRPGSEERNERPQKKI